MLGYLGHRRGHAFGYQALEDAAIRPLFERALAESKSGIIAAYSVEAAWLEAHVAELLRRFTNRALGDTILRLARDPLCKLDPEGRLVGAGRAAVTQNNYGRGETIYVGTIGDGASYHALTRWLSEKAGMEPLLATSRAVEVTAKEKEGRASLFLLNHASQDEKVELEKRCKDLWTDKAVEGETIIPAKGVLILTRE